MSIYAHIKRCLELSDRDLNSAIADRRLTKALLDQLAKVSKPSDGAPKLLLVFAKIAAAQVDWMDGALRVEMVGDADLTVVEVLSELGLGMHERVFPSFKMNVPLEEFARAVERVPHMIEPLSIAASTARRLVLTASEAEEEEDAAEAAPASSPVSISDDSMYAEEKRAPSKAKSIAPPAAQKERASRKSSKPAMAAVSAPKVISSRSGRTLRPAAPAPNAHARVAPAIVPRPPALPRSEARAAELAAAEAKAQAPSPPEPRRAIVARVPLTKMQVPRSSSSTGSRPPPKAPAAPKRASKPPAKRASMRPPPPSSKGSRPSKAPPPRAPSARPPRSGPPPKSKRPAVSEPPDEESIDTGWDEDS